MPITCPRCGAVSHHPKDEQSGYCGRCHDFTDAKQLVLSFGDMTIVGRWPGKMIKALAVVAMHLHPTYDRQPDAQPGGSKERCLFASLAVRDFLVEIGFKDAAVRGCGLVMRSFDKARTEIYSLGIGVPGAPDHPEKFNGHAVVTVPSLHLLIDITLYQAIRPAWGGALRGMFATEYWAPAGFKVYDRLPFSGAEIELEDRRFEMIWIDRPELRWKREVDFVRSPRRRALTRALIEAYGAWHE